MRKPCYNLPGGYSRGVFGSIMTDSVALRRVRRAHSRIFYTRALNKIQFAYFLFAQEDAGAYGLAHGGTMKRHLFKTIILAITVALLAGILIACDPVDEGMRIVYVSNAIVEDTADIIVHSGMALILVTVLP